MVLGVNGRVWFGAVDNDGPSRLKVARCANAARVLGAAFRPVSRATVEAVFARSLGAMLDPPAMLDEAHRETLLGDLDDVMATEMEH